MRRVAFGQFLHHGQSMGNVALFHHLLRRRQHDSRRMIAVHPPGQRVEQGERFIDAPGFGMEDPENLAVQLLVSVSRDPSEKAASLVALADRCKK